MIGWPGGPSRIPIPPTDTGTPAARALARPAREHSGLLFCGGLLLRPVAAPERNERRWTTEPNPPSARTMSAEWNDFVEHRRLSGARSAIHFGRPAIRIVAGRLHRALYLAAICRTGGLIDRARTSTPTRFLQGQCNPVMSGQVTAASQSDRPAYCSPKGRALACLRLFRRGDATYLELLPRIGGTRR